MTGLLWKKEGNEAQMRVMIASTRISLKTVPAPEHPRGLVEVTSLSA
jgi:hypothetical protein